MKVTVTDLRVHDVRFPTSVRLDGSDAMNPDPDYSAAYVEMHSDDGMTGYGHCFTIGRGNDLCVAAIQAHAPLVVGREIDLDDLGEFGRRLTRDSQLRWLGPEKGVCHMAVASLVNAAFDLAGRATGQPVWKLLAQLSPDQVVDLVDWRYLTDVLTPHAAADLLKQSASGKETREARLRAQGYPAYTTTPGWLGYDDQTLVRLCRDAVADGFTFIKLKVGGDPAADLHRLRLAREAVGTEVRIAVDANQCWDVDQAIERVRRLSPFDPWWIEEPTSPDDILGHAAIREAVRPVRVATGEHVHNRVMFKQLLRAEAIDVLQLDACRVGGVTENIAILLLAAHHDVPICPHAGGVGLCEAVQHLAMFDYLAVSGTMTGRAIEYVDHLHEHFVDPVRLRDGRYLAPVAPGMSTRMRPESVASHRFPDGRAWRRQERNPTDVR